MRELTALEARVIAVLVEKQATVPDTYPLSLNALVAGCNQKSARSPVMEASESDVAIAIDGLRALSLVVEVSGARVLRYEHNMPRVMGLPGAAVALLAVLMLRGPQTAAELRLNAERLHRFADIGSVEAFLDELASKPPPRVARLARAPGAREQRWAHLLCGDAPGRVVDEDERAREVEPVALTARAGPAGVEPAGEGMASIRFTLPQAKKLVHQLVIPLRWGDMDSMGHINNTLYFRYFEIVRLDWLFKVGVSTGPEGEGPVVINAFCNFLRQLEFPGEVLARHYVANLGRTSFDTYITLERTDEPGVIYAEGGSKTVWTDFRARSSRPVPEWLRGLIG